MMASLDVVMDSVSSLMNDPNISKWIDAAGILATFAITICVARLAFAMIQGIRLYMIAQLNCLQPDFVKRYGKWAVVTGASHGIGLAYAKELAARGMSLVLVDIVDLDEARRQVEAVPDVGDVETLCIDLADSSTDNFDRMRKQLDPDKRDIGILVNNAGTYPLKLEKFHEFQISYHLKLSNLNALHLLHTTHMILPGMIERRRGMIINVSSMGIFMTLPFMGLYNPSKSFVATFTRQLQAEYKSEPIDIVLLSTGPVRLYNIENESFYSRWLLMGPDEYVRSAINAATTGCNEFCGSMNHGFIMHLALLMENTGLLTPLIRLYQRVKPEGINTQQLRPSTKSNSTTDVAYYQQRLSMSPV